MAKDGTNRGGARPGAGRKKKALVDRIEQGRKAVVLEVPDIDVPEMPDVKEYLKAEQRMGELCAEEIYKETWEWLRERGCAEFVSPMLLEQYAMSAGRWVQLEGMISEYGFASRNNGNGASLVAAPFVSMAQAYMKQSNQLWYQIFQIVKENCSTTYSGGTPQDDVMERLLKAREGK